MTVAAAPVPVLEVGGTHVTAALVDPSDGSITERWRTRRSLDSASTAGEIVASLVSAARPIVAAAGPGPILGVAIPGPFDYARGIGRYEGVAKFESLNGIDVGDALREGLDGTVRDVAFVNDADAFVLGEWAFGAGAGHDQVAGITLGTGVGSGFVEHGRIVTDDERVPPEGAVHRLTIDGQPLEETISRRALLRAARAAIVDLPQDADVIDVAALARAGDAAARRIFDDAFTSLGAALAPWLARFDASVLVVGGSMSGSWDLVEPPLVHGIRTAVPDLGGLPVRPAAHPEESALIGAAVNAKSHP